LTVGHFFQRAGQKKMRARAGVNWLFLRKTQKRLASFCCFSWNRQERAEAYFVAHHFIIFFVFANHAKPGFLIFLWFVSLYQDKEMNGKNLTQVSKIWFNILSCRT
jgi:hypothetical protein